MGREESQLLSMMDGGSLDLLGVVLLLEWRQPPTGPSLNSIPVSCPGLCWGGVSVCLLQPASFTFIHPDSLSA